MIRRLLAHASAAVALGGTLVVLNSAATSAQSAPALSAAAVTPAEARAGWTPLFNGRNLDGWRGYKKADSENTRWKVLDGGQLCVVSSDGRDTRGALDIVTTKTYRDFELRWEWRVALGGNSGLKYLVLEDEPAAIGHEYQMIDDERHPDAKVGPTRQTAALYDIFGATNRPLKPAGGEFNQSRVIVKGTAVEHWLNGTKVLSYELESDALAKGIAASKFAKITRFGKRHDAHILLQDHGEEVCYRNIAIRTGS